MLPVPGFCSFCDPSIARGDNDLQPSLGLEIQELYAMDMDIRGELAEATGMLELAKVPCIACDTSFSLLLSVDAFEEQCPVSRKEKLPVLLSLPGGACARDGVVILLRDAVFPFHNALNFSEMARISPAMEGGYYCLQFQS